MVALPRGAGGPALALPEVVDQATQAGLKLPLLLRFSDILGDRLGKLQARLRRRHGRATTTPAATPRCIRSRSTSTSAWPASWSAQGGEGFGLEAGSKPELMAVLGWRARAAW